jgi:hypothetical protein
VAPAKRRGEQPTLQGSETRGATVATGTRDEGIAKILAPALATGEGARILIYGRTRWGKSTFACDAIAAAVEAGVADVALIHDPKYPDRSQYPGPRGDPWPAVSDPAQLGPAIKTAPIVVLRPPFSASDAAKVARALSEVGIRALLCMDETRRALGGQQVWADAKAEDGSPGAKSFEWLSLEGGGVGASLVLLVQRPRQLPGDATDSAQVHVVFGLGGRSLSYLVDQGTVPRDAADTVRRLQPGAFVVLADDEEWDRTVYYSPL